MFIFSCSVFFSSFLHMTFFSRVSIASIWEVPVSNDFAGQLGMPNI